ncbi:MAG: glutathione synthase [Deltaproteobacteria bacterium]|nr:glutathione synthase [Deltaproteobacteria bacterium]
MRIVFVMDPVSSVLVHEDTSYALMREAERRGHRVDHCLPRDVSMRGAEPFARVRRARCDDGATPPVLLDDSESVALADVDAVFVRKDPPFDDDYLWLSLLLEKLRGRTLVVNDPRGLREANEKLYACHFPELMPETLVSADAETIRAFVDEVGGRAVIKPVDGHGGEGIFAIRVDDSNYNALVETVTHSGRRLAMVQAFIPEVTEGDKRILLMDGEILGAILRVPQGGDLRSNIHVGGKVVRGEITDVDRQIVERVTPRLREDGLVFVGLDVIGGKLTEVNVTSPTGIQQMSRLDAKNCEAPVIDWIERQLGGSEEA